VGKPRQDFAVAYWEASNAVAAELPSLDGPMSSYGGVHEYPAGHLAVIAGHDLLHKRQQNDSSGYDAAIGA